MKEYDKMMLRSRKQMSETNMLMILLTISGGLQDAYSYFVRGEVFSNAQTGNIVLMSTYVAKGNWHRALHYLTCAGVCNGDFHSRASARTFQGRWIYTLAADNSFHGNGAALHCGVYTAWRFIRFCCECTFIMCLCNAGAIVQESK